MRVARGIAVAVVNEHAVAVAVHPIAVNDFAAVCRNDGLTVDAAARNVDAAVAAVAVIAGDVGVTRHRPHKAACTDIPDTAVVRAAGVRACGFQSGVVIFVPFINGRIGLFFFLFEALCFRLCFGFVLLGLV